MKNRTVARIVRNTQRNRDTVIGRYTYRANLCIGVIERIATSDIGRTWLDSDGNRFDAWLPICAVVAKV